MTVWSHARRSQWREHPGTGWRRRRLSPIAGFACVLSLALGACGAGGTPIPPNGTSSSRSPTPLGSTLGSPPSGPFVPTDYQQTCSTVTSWCQATTGQVPSSLRRPLALPRVAPGGACPVTHGARYANGQFGGIALGEGPVQPLLVPNGDRGVSAALRGVLRFRPGDDGWHQLKTLWFSTPGYQGPVLIRGRRLDGTNPVVFGEAPDLMDPQLPPGPTVNGRNGYREWPGATWLRSPGCYGWQVDGLGFTRVHVFQAVWSSRSD